MIATSQRPGEREDAGNPLSNPRRGSRYERAQDIQTDYCPTCQGLWLERGELDRMIERNLADDSRNGEQHCPGTRSPPATGSGFPR